MTTTWRSAVLYITAFGMEGCCLFALLVVGNSLMAQGNLPTPYLFSIYPIALVLNRGLGYLSWRHRYFITFNILLGIIGALVLTKVLLYPEYSLASASWWLAWFKSLGQFFLSAKVAADWLVLGASGLLWWRGLSLALTKLDFTKLATRFQFGAGILLLLLIISAGREQAKLPGAAQYVAAFFFFGLVGMITARAEESPGKGLLGHHRLWLSLTAIVTVLLVGIIIGNYVTQDFLRLLAQPFILFGQLIGKLLSYLASLFQPTPEPLTEQPMLTPIPELPPEDVPMMLRIPEVARKIGGIVFFAGFAALVLLVLYRLSSDIWRWLRRIMPTTPRGNLESLPGAWKADLKGMLLGLLYLLLGIPLWRFLIRATQGRFRATGKLPPLRQLYVDLQRWAANSGWPRQPQQTPLEFRQALSVALPSGQEDLTLITEAYIQMRYGQLSPTTHHRQLEESWKRLRRTKPRPRSEEI